MTKKKVIIIGGGVGGLTAATKLAQNDFDVTVYEKNNYCGGRCSRIYKDAFTFEQGAILYLFDDIYKRNFKELGEDLEKRVKFIDNKDHHQVFFEDGKFNYSKDIECLAREIELIEPCGDAKEKLQNFCAESKAIEKFVTENIFYQTYDNVWQMLWFWIMNFFNGIYPALFTNFYANLFNDFIPNVWTGLMTNLKILWAARSYTMHNSVNKYFKTDKVCQALTFQSLYFGISPYTGSSLFSILVAYEIASGLRYPEMGMASIVTALENIAEENGVKIIKNQSVRKILINRSARAIGVKLADKTIVLSDIVISNADLTYTYNKLLPPTKYAVELSKKDHVPSTITFFWGMDSKIEGLKSHNIFIPSDYKKLFEDIHDKKTIPDDPSFFIHIANRMDPGMGPKDCMGRPKDMDALTVIVPIGEMAGVQGGFDDKVEMVKKKVIKKLEDKLGIKDFASKIVTNIKTETPDTWQDKYNSWGGSILGISHCLQNLACFRPNQKCAEFDNLYFVGASTQPGAGVPLVMCSALSLVPKIVADHSAQKTPAIDCQ
ncbi:phytoene desaturase [Tetranychus urticae]|uniref:Phytoene desaturase n=1 Tax=Tetranychus urticae TaxID=32264 RepID=T1KHL4_TETUR|nr:phytoene desaturase [Tetranychus urticae]